MLSSVSETAITTLKSRVMYAQDDESIINDPMGIQIYNQLNLKVTESSQKKILSKKLQGSLMNYLVLRALKYDSVTKHFLEKYPDGLVVSLGAGLDTRYWRKGLNPKQYMELDLPEMVQIKKDLLEDNIPYTLIGQSVLDLSWVDQVETIQNKHVLFIAEGLLMYLPEDQVVQLFKLLGERFNDSEFIFEVVNKKYTTGLYKKMVEMKMKNRLDSDAGSAFQYGVRSSQEVENYSSAIEVIEEWSYIDDDRVHPKMLKLMRGFKIITRSQWTMRAKIGV